VGKKRKTEMEELLELLLEIIKALAVYFEEMEPLEVSAQVTSVAEFVSFFFTFLSVVLVSRGRYLFSAIVLLVSPLIFFFVTQDSSLLRDVNAWALFGFSVIFFFKRLGVNFRGPLFALLSFWTTWHLLHLHWKNVALLTLGFLAFC
jgi:hypothetical protein